MRVLVVGGGGREHAICWKLAQSPELETLYCAPGNPGIAAVAERVEIAAGDVDGLTRFAVERAVDLTVVGPELPLTLGLADRLRACGLAVFGPQRRAAELEGSKVFAKEFMDRHGIPSASFEVVGDADAARAAAAQRGFPVVLKADGLAAGKGVLIVGDEAALEDAVAVFFEERRFGSAGERVVVEECLQGEEVSFIALSDGERVVPMATSKDYKRIGEGDSGPNTGGMGAHSPCGILPADRTEEILETVMRPAVAGLAAENRRFVGFLYAGLMLTSEGPKVLEFNVRLGDPEAQPLLLRLEDDLLTVLAAAAAGELPESLRFAPESAACVVLASEGYPARPVKGEVIEGVEAAAAQPGVEVFHAGTARDAAGRLVSAGGRVLDVCARGADLAEALRRAYAACDAIHWQHKVLRRDIGARVAPG